MISESWQGKNTNIILVVWQSSWFREIIQVHCFYVLLLLTVIFETNHALENSGNDRCLCFLLGLLIMGFYGLLSMREAMMVERRLQIVQLLDFADSQLRYFHGLEL